MVVAGSSMEDPWKEEIDNSNIPIPIPQAVQVLEALKQASHNIQEHHHYSSDSDSDSDSPAIKALLELHTILSADQNLSLSSGSSALSHHLHRLKSLVDSLHNSKGLKSFLTRPLSAHSISRVAASIESELQHWIDRETTRTLSQSLNDPVSNENDNELLPLLTRFTDRVSKGFNRELQQLVLKFRLFSSLQSVLCDAKCSQRVREHAGLAVAALIRFNKDVFVGEVLMGPTARALIAMASVPSVDVLCSLIRSIRSPIVDEIESNGEITNIIALLSSRDLKLRVLAMECVLEIGYFGRKEAVEAMLKEGLVEKLVELQRSEVGGDCECEKKEKKKKEGEKVGGGKRLLERNPFASCVARFAVQLEVGEGLRQREKRAFKPEILIRVREASLSDAEAATIVAEVLWGTSP